MPEKQLSILAGIDTNELVSEAPFLSLLEIGNEPPEKFSMDDMAFMSVQDFYASATPPPKNYINPKKGNLKYWVPIKNEFVILLCTEDKKYDELRENIRSYKTPVLTTVSAAIGAKLGVESAVIINFCAICIYFAVKIHKEAFCTELRKSNK